ncbi:hypothetical protein Y032_0016g2998 [Ancylostoma ceylanicum]|uniref:Uncharacterized protein n=1 Tax=Ancylostoma ceylanicum TaxID=53326 RepID=A0A016V806_9BILA|nr:hypothetical protein Y032_0016g2998 [Ancylostoma ceylanicum]
MNRVIRPLQICVKDPRDRSPGNTSVRFSKGTEIFLCWRLKIFLDACTGNVNHDCTSSERCGCWVLSSPRRADVVALQRAERRSRD